MTLGTKLRQIREKRRLSQQEVADYLNISQSTYCQWESDRKTFRVEYLFKLAQLFGVSYNDLLPGDSSSSSDTMSISTSKVLDMEVNYTTLTPIPDVLLDLLNSKNEIIRLLTLENQKLLHKKEAQSGFS